MEDLRWEQGTLLGCLRGFDASLEVGEGRWRPIVSQEVVFVRTDPPVDARYLAALWLLDAVERQGVRVVNRPSALTWANEKTLILNFPDLIPPTQVCMDPQAIHDFVRRLGRAVIKPLDGNGGRGVVVLDQADRNLNALVELSLAPGAPVMVQGFVPDVAEGDRRVLLVDGEPLAVLNRVASADDWRCNMHVGAEASWVELNDADRHVCAQLKPFLRQHGLFFTGIDIIGDRLTEINVTSPTGVEEVLAGGGPDVADATIRRLLA
jgi:glutathione synthase